jgi:hypothetical protein
LLNGDLGNRRRTGFRDHWQRDIHACSDATLSYSHRFEQSEIYLALCETCGRRNFLVEVLGKGGGNLEDGKAVSASKALPSSFSGQH